MALGSFLGGVASGMNDADKIAIQQQLADQKGQEIDQKGEAIGNLHSRMLSAEADKSIAGMLKVAVDTIQQSKAAGADPAKISSVVQPMLDDISGISQRTGRDPSPILHQVQAVIDAPMPGPGAPKPSTELGKLHADLDAGLIKPDEFTARVNRLTAPAHQPNTVETIRQKLSVGDTLSTGEQKVYDDALKADPIARLISSSLGGRSNVSAPTSAPVDPLGVR